MEEGNLAHNVSVLRKILGHAANGSSYIETVPRHGYRFLGEVKPVKSSPSPSFARHGSTAIRSIAVLPLQNLSRHSNNVYFADGMTEALITGLAQTLPLRVISRTSIMRYKRIKKSLPAIGEELNVDAIVEGTVFRSGRRVRITVQLLHARTDQHFWAMSYKGASENAPAQSSGKEIATPRHLRAAAKARSEKAAAKRRKKR